MNVELLLQELIEQQKQVMLTCAQRIVPQVIADDLMQPNDFPELENNPLFRYEEGVLAGIQTVEMALRAFKKDSRTEDQDRTKMVARASRPGMSSNQGETPWLP